MKKLLVITLVLLTAHQLKAKQLPAPKLQSAPFALKPQSLNLEHPYVDSLSKMKIGGLNDYTHQPFIAPKSNRKVKVSVPLSTGTTFYSRMPVAKLHSDDRMPIAEKSNTMAYNMPVMRIKVINPDTINRIKILGLNAAVAK